MYPDRADYMRKALKRLFRISNHWTARKPQILKVHNEMAHLINLRFIRVLWAVTVIIISRKKIFNLYSFWTTFSDLWQQQCELFNPTDLTTTSRFIIKFRNCRIHYLQCRILQLQFEGLRNFVFILTAFPMKTLQNWKKFFRECCLNIFLCQRGKSYLNDALKSLGFKISLILLNSICTACSYSTGKTSGWSQCSNSGCVS